ncbi:hypothetical protein M405DRAFT_826220 [Rhizopogon salebrosus TDB-379]|nr:hypothetical protein M405DRAFT_826220 [Rhizopogon salebrosus TDB-379]
MYSSHETWADHLIFFDHIPFAAASIGQVNHAVLAPSQGPSGRHGQSVATSLLTNAATRVTSVLERCGAPQCLSEDPQFKDPWVRLGSTGHVLAVGHVRGIGIWGTVIGVQPQEEWNEITSRMIEFCLRGLFQFMLTQTDPSFLHCIYLQWLWRNAQVQERVRGPLAALSSGRYFRGPHRMRRVKVELLVSHQRRMKYVHIWTGSSNTHPTGHTVQSISNALSPSPFDTEGTE